MICFYRQAKKTSILDPKEGYKKSQSKEALFRDGGSNQKKVSVGGREWIFSEATCPFGYIYF